MPVTHDVSIGHAAALGADGMLDLARAAAGAGFGRIWVSETFMADPMIMTGALARELPGHPLGIGPLPTPLRTGPQLAMIAATLEALGTPCEIIVGASSPTMTDGWHARGIATVARTEALFAATRAANSGGRTDIGSGPFRTKGFTNGLGPVRAGLGLAALGPRMLELGGRVADRVALNLCGPSALPGFLEHIDAGADAGGRTRPKVSVWTHVTVDPTEADVARGARFLAGYVRVPGYREAMAEQGFADIIEAAAAAPSAREIRGLISDKMLTDVLGFGTATEARARAEEMASYGVELTIVPGVTSDPAGQRTLAALAGNNGP